MKQYLRLSVAVKSVSLRWRCLDRREKIWMFSPMYRAEHFPHSSKNRLLACLKSLTSLGIHLFNTAEELGQIESYIQMEKHWKMFVHGGKNWGERGLAVLQALNIWLSDSHYYSSIPLGLWTRSPSPLDFLLLSLLLSPTPTCLAFGSFEVISSLGLTWDLCCPRTSSWPQCCVFI